MKLNTLIAAGLTATLLGTGFAYAQTAPAAAQVVVKNDMIAQLPDVIALIKSLKAQGYTYIEIRRTLLGRARVIAQGPKGTREVVMSSSTGEVMRDDMQSAHADGANEHKGTMENSMTGGNDGMNGDAHNAINDAHNAMDDAIGGMTGGMGGMTGGMGDN